MKRLERQRADPATRCASWGASIVARVIAESFDPLDGPPTLVSADATPVPYAGALERVWVSDAERVAHAVRESVASG
ncbi:MAG TPA: hypothetical protein VK631_28360 [Solirubrobacteraceae bacterium]|nr:hypothetical protein [Solirubrobacteraceae bacterium]